MAVIYELSEQNKQRSLALIEVIRQAITANAGKIPFSHFMALALYHPVLGYYNAETFSIGASGDFTTAPEISPLFARCFARQCQPILTQHDTRNLLELGPGSGKFASDLLAELQLLNCLPDKYYLFEISPVLRVKQQALLEANHPQLRDRIIWLDELPRDFRGVIIGNEVLDALPVDIFQVQNNAITERCVSWDGNQFSWAGQPASSAIRSHVSELSLPSDYQSEAHSNLPAFVSTVCDNLDKGLILFADYGYGRNEYYHPERKTGTLTCFYQHTRHNDPLIMPGLQDITAHVDFTHVIECASEHGCQLAGFTTQAGFLLANGLMSFAEEMSAAMTIEQEFQLNQAIKMLTLPTEMGETIKVMGLSKGLPTPLSTFTLQDRRRDL